MSDSTITKSKLFKEDIALATGGTGAEETGTRLTSVGGVVTLTKLDLGHIPYRSFSGTPEDLLDGGYDIDIKPRNVDAGGTLDVVGAVTLDALTPAGYVKNSAAGLLSTGAILAADLPTAIDATKIGAGLISNTEFGYLNNAASNIQTQINTIIAGAAVTSSYAILQNRQAQNVHGGGATSGSWLIIPLNTEYEDADSIIDSTALPAFTLAAGTYLIEGSSIFYAVWGAQIRLYNVTAAAAAIIGTCIFTYYGNNSLLMGTVTIAASAQFRLEYQVENSELTMGLGKALNFGPEVYAQVKITKIA